MADPRGIVESLKVAAIVPAAGAGKRMKGQVRKPFLLLQGKPILAHTLELLEHNPFIDAIWIAGPREELSLCRTIIEQFRYRKVVDVVVGGKTRQESVGNALIKIGEEYSLILVHDAVRPLCPQELIQRVIETAAESHAAILAVPVKDTVKILRENSGRLVASTLDRGRLVSTQTPQVFQSHLLREAYRKADEDHFEGTDEAVLVERLSHPINVVQSSYENIKITTPEDLVVAEMILAKRPEPPSVA